MTQDQSVVSVSFDPDSMASIRTMAQRLDKTPQELVAEAMALLRFVQGRKVILKDKDKAETIEIRNWENQPVLRNIKP